MRSIAVVAGLALLVALGLLATHMWETTEVPARQGDAVRSGESAGRRGKLARVENAQPIATLQRSFRVGDRTISREGMEMEMSLGRAASALPQLLSGDIKNPRRHFGPFYRGSGLEQVQVRIDGTSVSWYWNDFFVGNADVAWYTRYLPGPPSAVLDVTPGPYGVPRYVPGEMPASTGMHDLLFTLERVSYSSRFGGSVELLFRSEEDYEYEFRLDAEQWDQVAPNRLEKVDILWDAQRVDLLLYVSLVPSAFNSPNPGNVIEKKVGVVIQAARPVAYSLRSVAGNASPPPGPIAGTTITRARGAEAETATRQLPGLLEELGHQLQSSPGLGWTAGKFAHGYFHAQFQEDIGTTHLVDMIEIRDGYADPWTRAGVPKFYVALKVDPVNLDTEIGGEEIVVDLGVQHFLSDAASDPEKNPAFGKTFEPIDRGEGTPYWYGSVIRLDDCPHLLGMVSGVSIVEEDDFVDDRFTAEFFNVPLPACSTLEAAHAAGDYGTVGRPEGQVGFIYRGEIEDAVYEDGRLVSGTFEDLYGTFTLWTRVSLWLR